MGPRSLVCCSRTKAHLTPGFDRWQSSCQNPKYPPANDLRLHATMKPCRFAWCANLAMDTGCQTLFTSYQFVTNGNLLSGTGG